jgi:hypothetical protein
VTDTIPEAREALLLELQAAIPGTCDWGGCDNNALLARFDPEKGWLPVCQWHAGDASAADLAPITAVAFEEQWLAALPDSGERPVFDSLDVDVLARALGGGPLISETYRQMAERVAAEYGRLISETR